MNNNNNNNNIKITSINIKSLKNKDRLCAHISINNNNEVIWYEVEKKYSKYFVTEKVDAFVIALMFTAVSYGLNIKSDIPISRSLYYNLILHFIPQLAYILNKHMIKLLIPITDKKIPSKKCICTGFSKGLDSFYTLKKHNNKKLKYIYRLTHLVCINNGVFEGENALKDSIRLYKDTKKIADELNLTAILINSNIQDVLNENYIEINSYRHISAVMSLQKLFHIYLYSSSYSLEEFKFERGDIGIKDLYTCKFLSTDDFKIFSAGSGVRRVDKLKEVVIYELAHKYLHTCFINTSSNKNCGHCKKCRRETVCLIALNKIDKFKKVYDIELAKKNFDINVAFILANKDDKNFGEVIDLLKEQNINISKRSYVLAKQFEKAMINLKNDNM